MCPPKFYGVKYVINPWMEGNVGKVNNELASEQWNRLYIELQNVADVELIEQHPSMPDMVFTANAGIVIPQSKVFISSYMSKKQRQQEQHVFGHWFERRKYHVDYLDIQHNAGNYFEGEGDCLLGLQNDFGGEHHEWFHYGYGQRSTNRGCVFAEELINDRAWPYYHASHRYLLVDPRFYHFDTCHACFDDNIIAYADAFQLESGPGTGGSDQYWRDTRNLKNVIYVTEEDALRFACNLIAVGKTIIMPLSSPELKQQIEQLGYRVLQLDMSEFLKAGGACKCLVLTLER